MPAFLPDIIAGCHTGILKGIAVTKGTFENFFTPESAKDSSISCMCWANDDQTDVLCGLVNRQLKVFDSVNQSFTPAFECTGGSGNLKGIATNSNRIVSGVESGAVKVWSPLGEEQTQIEAGQNLSRLRLSPFKESRLATGGRENPLKLWDLEHGNQPLFTAKNVRPTWLELRSPVWITDMQFLPDGEKLAVATGHHQIRLYDPKAGQRRPVLDINFDEYPITSLSLCCKENCLVAGNTHGKMALFDMRGKGKAVQVYSGFAGTITDIQCHPEFPIIASCGLDRFVRVHNLNTKELLQKVYVKSKINCLLLSKDLSVLLRNMRNADHIDVAAKQEIKEELVDEDNVSDTEIWDRMPEVVEPIKSNKRKAAETAEELLSAAINKPVLKTKKSRLAKEAKLKKHKSQPEPVEGQKRLKLSNGAKLISVKRRHSGSSDEEKSSETRQLHRHIKSKRSK